DAANFNIVAIKSKLNATKFILLGARMVLDDDGPQVFTVYVSIDFGSRNALMTKHILYSSQVGAAFYQVTGKRVAEGVGTDIFFQADFCREAFDDDKDHH